MKKNRRIYYFMLAFVAIIMIGLTQSLTVKADDTIYITQGKRNKWETDPFSNLPVVEVDKSGKLIGSLPVKVSMWGVSKGDPYFTFLPIDNDSDDYGHVEGLNEAFKEKSGLLGNKTYVIYTSNHNLQTNVYNEPSFNYDSAKKTFETSNSLSESQFYSGIPVRLIAYKPTTINFVDESGTIVGTSSQSVDLKDDDSVDTSTIQLPDKLKKIYVVNNNKTIDATNAPDTLNIPVEKTTLRAQISVVVNGHAFNYPTDGLKQIYPDPDAPLEYQPLIDLYNEAMPKNVEKKITVNLESGGGNLGPIEFDNSTDFYDYLFKKTDSTGILAMAFDQIRFDGAPNNSDITIKAEYSDDTEITGHVKIDSNLDSVESEKEYSGKKIGDSISNVLVPSRKGYTADKKTVPALIYPDGSIKSTEKVKYTKVSDNNSSHNHSSSNQAETPKTSNLNKTTNVATSDKAAVYNDSANKTNQTIDKDQTFVVSKKMTKGGDTYYQIADGKWINANDVYLYDSVKDYFRTYGGSGSYTTLLHSDRSLVTNRALAAGTDWYFDRVTEFGGAKYFRVASDEWVKANEGTSYEPESNIINVSKDTSFYDENGKKLGVFGNNIALKSDRITNINGQAMYRVATNEYVLVSQTNF